MGGPWAKHKKEQELTATDLESEDFMIDGALRHFEIGSKHREDRPRVRDVLFEHG